MRPTTCISNKIRKALFTENIKFCHFTRQEHCHQHVEWSMWLSWNGKGNKDIYLDTMPVCYNKQFRKVEMILTVSWINNLSCWKRARKNSALTNNRTLTFVMTRQNAPSIKLSKPAGLQDIYFFMHSSKYESFPMFLFNTCKQFVYEQALSSLWFSFTWTDSFYYIQAWCCPSC